MSPIKRTLALGLIVLTLVPVILAGCGNSEGASSDPNWDKRIKSDKNRDTNGEK